MISYFKTNHMRYKDLSLIQNYNYKGWRVFLNGKSHFWRNSCEFHITINFCEEIANTIFMPIIQKQNLTEIKKLLLKSKMIECPDPYLASYKINIKKVIDLFDAPYVRNAIQQVNRDIDSNLGDAITYIQSHHKEIERKVQLLLQQI